MTDRDQHKPVKIPHLPKLPKEATARLRTGACFELEREIYEAYLRFYKKNAEIGITPGDISGPESIHHTYEVCLRRRVEDRCNWARRRMLITKRVATSAELPYAKGVELLSSAAEHLKEAQQVEQAYKLACWLWVEVRKRVLGLVAEQDLRKQLLHSINEGEAEPGALEQAPDIPFESDQLPKYGVYEPLPKDAVAPLTKHDDTTPEIRAEVLYNMVKQRCEDGELCVAQLTGFQDTLMSERMLLDKAKPGEDRFQQIVIFNNLVCSWSRSFAHLEFEAHKRFTRENNLRVFDKAGAPIVPQEVRERPFIVSKPGLDGCGSLMPITSGPASNSFIHAVIDAKGDEAEGVALHPTFVDEFHVDSEEPGAGSSSGSSVSRSLDMVLSGEWAGTDNKSDHFVDEDKKGDEGLCVGCLERPAVQVLRACGHLVYCRSCQRKAVASQLGGTGQQKALTRRRAGQLGNNQLERTRVRCPVCREETVFVRRDKFSGVVYTV